MKKDKHRLERWYEKGFPWVFKKNCVSCGVEFYSLNSSQLVCDQENCKAKWEIMQQEAEQKIMPQEKHLTL